MGDRGIATNAGKNNFNQEKICNFSLTNFYPQPAAASVFSVGFGPASDNFISRREEGSGSG